MYTLQVKTHFDAAHFLRDYEGKCRRMHGHRWEVEVSFEGALLDDKNMLIDFKEVKALLNSLLDELLDHCTLNDTLHEPNPTAEFLARWLYEELEKKGVPYRLTEVAIWESPECCVRYAPSTQGVL